MKITVDTDVIIAVGRMEDAVVLSHIAYWVEQNKQQGKNKHDGKCWTYNSLTNYQKVFSFWSLDTVKRIFKRLKDNGWLITGNFNEAGFDKTTWYTLSETAEMLMSANCTYREVQNAPIDECKMHPRLGQNAPTMSANCTNGWVQNAPMDECKMHPPIPKNNQIKTQKITAKDNNKENEAQNAPPSSPKWSLRKELDSFTQDPEVREALEAFMESRKKMSVPNTERAVSLLLKKLQPHAPDIQLAMLNKSIERGWKGLFELKEKDLQDLGYQHEQPVSNNPQVDMVRRAMARLQAEEEMESDYG